MGGKTKKKRKRKYMEMADTKDSCHDVPKVGLSVEGAFPSCSCSYQNNDTGNKRTEKLIPPRQHWLSEIKFLSKSSSTTMHIRQQEPCLESTNYLEPSSFEHLSYQLNQMKRQLWPAAIQCSKRWKRSNIYTTPKEVFHIARQRCNPWEKILDGYHYGFINRSAMKLANINFLTNFTLFGTSSLRLEEEDTNRSTRSVNKSLVFVDLCGAPGGFSEYIFSMCKDVLNIPAFGFGMSLVGTNQHGTGFDWNLYHPNFLIVNGYDGTGDIYKWENIQWLRKIILQRNSCHTTVDLVVADGGLDVQRDSEIQETLTYELFVSQVAAALFLLKQGGNFVVKFFGSQNTETKVVIQHLFSVFEKISIVKPIVSRPASSERYLICLNYDPPPQQEQPLWDAQIWRDQMIKFACHHKSSSNEEVDHKNHPVPELEEYLDNNSREMFSLNMKACRDIVSMLETMTSDQANGQTADEEAYHHIEHGIHSYQSLWKLSNAHKQTQLLQMGDI